MSTYNIFANGVATRPTVIGELGFFGNDSAWLNDNDTFVWDSGGLAASNPTLGNVGGRPCLSITSSGASATADQAQFQTTVAGVLLGTSTQTYRQKGSFRCTTVTQDIAFGLSVVDTSIIASDTTNFIRLQKLAAATSFSLYYGKSVGSATTTGTFGPTIAADTWYDYELEISKYNSTTGSGRVKVYMGTDLAAGGQLSLVFDQVIASNFPDTVAMASFGAWRAGSAAAVSFYMNYFGVKMA